MASFILNGKGNKKGSMAQRRNGTTAPFPPKGRLNLVFNLVFFILLN
jgi:hypothetical protein